MRNRLWAGIVVGFDTLGRTGELLNLVVEDVLVDTTSGFAGARQGVDQSVTITSLIVRGAVRFLCKGLNPGAPSANPRSEVPADLGTRRMLLGPAAFSDL